MRGVPAGAPAEARAPLPAVNANEEFCSIVMLSIDKLKVVMAAEIDCVAERSGTGAGAPVSPGYVELKTSKAHRSARDVEVFE